MPGKDDGDQPTLFDATLDLAAAAGELIEQDVAASTVTAYRRWASRFAEFCTAHHRTALPTTSDTLAEFVAWMATREYSPSTIEQAIAAVLWNHHDTGRDAPDPTLARKALGGYRRQWAKTNRVKKASPIKDQHLTKMVGQCDLKTPRGLRDRMILTLGKALAARRSELVGIDIEDVWFDDDGWMNVFVGSSKTDQYGRGEECPVPYEADPMICPVRATRDWLDWLRMKGVTTGPLIRNLTPRGDKLYVSPLAKAPRTKAGGMDGEAINRLVKRYATRAGVRLRRSSAHGLRAGGVTESYERGAPVPSLQELGRYAKNSPTVFGYVREVDKKKEAAGRYGKPHLDRQLPDDEEVDEE